MKGILLGYLLLALFYALLRRWINRVGYALALWNLGRTWRVAWSIACRRYP